MMRLLVDAPAKAVDVVFQQGRLPVHSVQSIPAGLCQSFYCIHKPRQVGHRVNTVSASVKLTFSASKSSTRSVYAESVPFQQFRLDERFLSCLRRSGSF